MLCHHSLFVHLNDVHTSHIMNIKAFVSHIFLPHKEALSLMHVWLRDIMSSE